MTGRGCGPFVKCSCRSSRTRWSQRFTGRRRRAMHAPGRLTAAGAWREGRFPTNVRRLGRRELRAGRAARSRRRCSRLGHPRREGDLAARREGTPRETKAGHRGPPRSSSVEEGGARPPFIVAPLVLAGRGPAAVGWLMVSQESPPRFHRRRSRSRKARRRPRLLLRPAPAACSRAPHLLSHEAEARRASPACRERTKSRRMGYSRSMPRGLGRASSGASAGRTHRRIAFPFPVDGEGDGHEVLLKEPERRKVRHAQVPRWSRPKETSMEG